MPPIFSKLILLNYISSDRTDYNTLIPIVEKHYEMTGINLLDITADSGYCSEKNLKLLKNWNKKLYKTSKTRKKENQEILSTNWKTL